MDRHGNTTKANALVFSQREIFCSIPVVQLPTFLLFCLEGSESALRKRGPAEHPDSRTHRLRLLLIQNPLLNKPQEYLDRLFIVHEINVAHRSR